MKGTVMSDTHTKTMPDGRLLDILKLIELLAPKTKTMVETSIIKGVNKSRQTGFSSARYAAADLQFPVIIDGDRNLIDGRHRLLKAKNEGRICIWAYVASKEEIEECIIDVD
jgi:hypothetical protein